MFYLLIPNRFLISVIKLLIVDSDAGHHESDTINEEYFVPYKESVKRKWPENEILAL